MELEEAIKELKSLSPSEKAIETVLKELEHKNNTIKMLKDKMIADRMEQFDDYNIYLINSFLNIIGDEENDS